MPTPIFFFRVRAVIPLYLLVPSYLALRGNWKTPKTQGFSQKTMIRIVKKKNRCSSFDKMAQPLFATRFCAIHHFECSLRGKVGTSLSYGFNCRCFWLFWIGPTHVRKCIYICIYVLYVHFFSWRFWILGNFMFDSYPRTCAIYGLLEDSME